MGWILSKFAWTTGATAETKQATTKTKDQTLKCPCDQPARYRLQLLRHKGESVQDALTRYGYEPYWFHKYHVSSTSEEGSTLAACAQCIAGDLQAQRVFAYTRLSVFTI